MCVFASLPLEKYALQTQSKYQGEHVLSDVTVRISIESDDGKGFFVEAGALDGEYLSNSLLLEKDFGWTGLLVEPDEDNYKQLLKTNRHAWLSPSCLAIHPYPHTALLKKLRETNQSSNWLSRGNTALMKVRRTESCMAQ